jgi:uridine kinase
MKPIFIGITGGTGAGKSTLCNSLQRKYPEKIGLIQLDDYFKPMEKKPKVGDIISSDHPESLYLDKLADDLLQLSDGNAVIINTKNEYLNPAFERTKRRIPIEFQPKPIMLVEGFLVLYEGRIRKILSTSIWLEIGHETRWARRVHFKNDEYEKKVLIPMHAKYTEPTKKYANHVLDVSNLSKEQVFEKANSIINNIV